MMINTLDRHLYQATTRALWRFATTGALWRDATTAWPRWGPTIDPCGVLVASAAR